ncbi:ArsR/SmtB family transcription factor [Paenibacillus caui]|uniref:ArsR/SmtB family transcription factor n=1 Tax=Paenibacillus caui TaxID=2873927 RepID=UPI001CAA233D
MEGFHHCNNKEQVAEKFKEVSAVFQALGDPNRQKIILLLMQFDRLTVNGITDHLNDLSRPAISHHLKIMRLAGLIDFKKLGKEKFYYLRIDNSLHQVKQLIQIIEESCSDNGGRS